jgi:hypothetical protein
VDEFVLAVPYFPHREVRSLSVLAVACSAGAIQDCDRLVEARPERGCNEERPLVANEEVVEL